jgi:hypothetical protein
MIRDLENVGMFWTDGVGDWIPLDSMLDTLPVFAPEGVCMRGWHEESNDEVTLTKEEEKFYADKALKEVDN